VTRVYCNEKPAETMITRFLPKMAQYFMSWDGKFDNKFEGDILELVGQIGTWMVSLKAEALHVGNGAR